MEILYLWIENENDVIKKQGFNFSGKYHFSFADGVLSGEINAHRNPEKFFNIGNKDDVKINNVTAIVGQNGSGKTSLLKFIRDQVNYIDSVTSNAGEIALVFKSSYLLIIEDQGQILLYNHGVDNVRISGQIEITEGEFEVVHRKNFDEEAEEFYDSDFVIPALNRTKIVYFSNVFDMNIGAGDHYYDFNDIFLDISTNAFAFEEYDMYRRGYQISETLRQIRFIFSPFSSVLNSKKPDFVVIKTTNSSNFKNSMRQIGFDYREIQIIETFISDWINEKNIMKSAICQIVHASVLDYVKAYVDIQDKNTVKDNIMILHILRELIELANGAQTIVAEELISLIKDKLSGLFENVEPTPQNGYESIDEIGKRYESRILLIKALRQAISYSEIQDQLKIPISEHKIIEDVIINNSLSRFEYNILRFEFLGLSSGEKAMLQTYSRFYWLIDRYINESSYRTFGFTDAGYDIKYYKLKENLIILIDEGELFLHPNWQREYIYNMLNLFNELFKSYHEVQHVQVIISSNSPFVVSDLPKENLILLENRDGECHVLDESAKFDTFGANIHMLLSNTFFMTNGVIGEFAKYKINEVIRILQDKIDEGDQDEVQYIINSIGEPVIRSKLQGMYNLKYHNQLQSVEDEINRLNLIRERILLERAESDDKNTSI